MAEIKIEEKKRSNLLPLILAAVLLLALLGWCATRNNDDGSATAGADTMRAVGDTATGAGAAGVGAAGAGAASGAAGGAVGDFASYVAARDTTQETEGNHQYTAGGVRRLAAALESIAAGNPNIGVYADSMRSSIDRLQRSANTDKHADDAKAAFSAAVSAMEQIDRARGRTRDVAPMRTIYNELDSQQTLMPQLPVVQRFFEAARDALQAMGAS
ncbi:MAG: hypothetical protein V4617_13885 [Gemmatimonadota bacterium]